MDGDLAERYHLETSFVDDEIEHTTFSPRSSDSSSRPKRIKQRWRKRRIIAETFVSQVRLEEEARTGQVRAVKVLATGKNSATSHTSRSDYYERELVALALVRKYRPYFVEFYGWFRDEHHLYLAMEYMEEGDLSKHMNERWNEKDIQEVAVQLLEGLVAIHGMGITHRDLKPQNIFVVKRYPIWIKLGDLGISKRVKGDTTSLHTQVYTAAYGAPEVRNIIDFADEDEDYSYSNVVDIWSLGCVLYQLFAGVLPFGIEIRPLRLYYYGRRDFPYEELRKAGASAKAQNFIRSALTPNPAYRPSASQSFECNWIQEAILDDETNSKALILRGPDFRARLRHYYAHTLNDEFSSCSTDASNPSHATSPRFNPMPSTRAPPPPAPIMMTRRTSSPSRAFPTDGFDLPSPLIIPASPIHRTPSPPNVPTRYKSVPSSVPGPRSYSPPSPRIIPVSRTPSPIFVPHSRSRPSPGSLFNLNEWRITADDGSQHSSDSRETEPANATWTKLHKDYVSAAALEIRRYHFAEGPTHVYVRSKLDENQIDELVSLSQSTQLQTKYRIEYFRERKALFAELIDKEKSLLNYVRDKRREGPSVPEFVRGPNGIDLDALDKPPLCSVEHMP